MTNADDILEHMERFVGQIETWLVALQDASDAAGNTKLGSDIFALRCWIQWNRHEGYVVPPPPRDARMPPS